MKTVRKKGNQIIQAYCLGAGSEMERLLIQAGKIRKTKDRSYELCSTESRNTGGERALEGDYFKVDGLGNPYPNAKEWFEYHHIALGEDFYRQKKETYLIWEEGDACAEPLQYLLDQKLLTIHEADEKHYFEARIYGTVLSASRDAVLIFYQIERDQMERIRKIDFNLVDRREFERTYQYVTEQKKMM